MALQGKAPSDHNHDGRYYTEEEINNVISNLQTQINNRCRIDAVYTKFTVVAEQWTGFALHGVPDKYIPSGLFAAIPMPVISSNGDVNDLCWRYSDSNSYLLRFWYPRNAEIYVRYLFFSVG